MELFVVFFVWLTLGAATTYLAAQKGRDPLLWAMLVLLMSFLGLPFALIGLGVLYFLPAIEVNKEIEPKEAFASRSPESLAPLFNPTAVSDWFYYDSARVRHGPKNYQEIKNAWDAGSLVETNYIWCEQFEAWKIVRDVPELLDVLTKK